MTENVMMGSGANTASSTTVSGNGSTYYGPYGAATPVNSANTTESSAQVKNRGTGTLKNLRSYIDANARTTTTNIKGRLNTADGAMALAITSTATGVTSDTTHSDTLADGDLINYDVVMGASAEALTLIGVTVEIDSNAGAYVQTGGFGSVSTTGASSSNYIGLGGKLNTTSTTETNKNVGQTESATISRLQVILSANSRTNTTNYKSRLNGADGTQLCAFTSTASGLVEDTTHSDALVSTDLWCGVQVNGTGTQSITLRYAGVKYASGTASRCPMIWSGQTVGPSATRFGSFFGGSSWSVDSPTTDGSCQVAAALAGTALNLSARVPTNSQGTNKTLAFRLNGANGNGAAVVTANTTGTFTDSTHTDALAAADKFCFSPASGNSVTYASISALFSTGAAAYTLAAGAGSFALTGVAAGLLAGHHLAVAAGAVTLTGKAVTLVANYPLVVGTGAVSLTGKAVGLYAGWHVGVGTGAFVLTGKAAAFVWNHPLSVGTGAFVLTGKAAAFVWNHPLSVGTAAFTLAGKAAALIWNHPLVVGTGVIALVGKAVGLIFGPRLAAGTGAFVLTGRAVALTWNHPLAVGTGAFTASGQDVALTKAGGNSATLTVGTGGFALGGQAAGLTATRLLAAGAASFALTGQTAGLTLTRRTAAGAGAFALGGQAAGLRAARDLAAGAGVLTLTGVAAALRIGRDLAAGTGAIVLSGQAAGLKVTHVLPAGAAGFSLGGRAVGLAFGARLPASAASFTLAGVAVSFALARLLSAQAGTFTVAGQDALFALGLPNPGYLGRPITGRMSGPAIAGAFGRQTLIGRASGGEIDGG